MSSSSDESGWWCRRFFRRSRLIRRILRFALSVVALTRRRHSLGERMSLHLSLSWSGTSDGDTASTVYLPPRLCARRRQQTAHTHTHTMQSSTAPAMVSCPAHVDTSCRHHCAAPSLGAMDPPSLVTALPAVPAGRAATCTACVATALEPTVPGPPHVMADTVAS